MLYLTDNPTVSIQMYNTHRFYNDSTGTFLELKCKPSKNDAYKESSSDEYFNSVTNVIPVIPLSLHCSNNLLDWSTLEKTNLRYSKLDIFKIVQKKFRDRSLFSKKPKKQ